MQSRRGPPTRRALGCDRVAAGTAAAPARAASLGTALLSTALLTAAGYAPGASVRPVTSTPPEPGAGRRCEWADASEAMRRYHDLEWGVPSRDDRHLFEMLVLEGAQAGLSWSTILGKRDGYRRAFGGFDPEKVAGYGEARIESLLGDPGIVRNRLKVRGAVTNAGALLSVCAEQGSFAEYLWAFVDGRPVVNEPRSAAEVPARSELSDRVGKDLKRRGFTFVGSTIVYAYLQAVGVVDDHLVTCSAKTSGGPPTDRRRCG